MPGLRELQHSMSAAIVGGTRSDIDAYVVTDDISAAERLDIYRSTYLTTLTAALRISYPAVQRLVGAEFFEGAARQFIEAHPPQSAHLNLFGAAFAEFLAQFPPAASLVYLADVARLEWAFNCALHARDVPPLDIARLESLSEFAQARLRFVAQPSVGFVRSLYPVDEIWRAVLAEDDAALATIDLAAGPISLMIARWGEDIDVARLGETEWRFAARLCAGDSLASIMRAVPDAQGPAMLARHLAKGLFVDFELSDDEISSEGGERK